MLEAVIGPRRNAGSLDTASWIVAVIVLAVAIPANDKIASNGVFFAAHGVSPYAWTAVLLAGLVTAWLILAGILTLVRRKGSPATFDAVTSLLVLGITWFLAGNALALTLLAPVPWLAPILGLAVAVVVTLLSRRFRMGAALLVCAGVAAAIPLLTTAASAGEPTTSSAFSFAAADSRPNILWVIADEMQYPVAFNAEGQVRPEFGNLAALQQTSTTYTHAYAVANYTDYAVPSMLTGIADVSAEPPRRMQQVRSNIGIVPGLAGEYQILMESPIYRYECNSASCASTGAASDANVLARLGSFAADTAAITGRTVLAAPFDAAFPSLDGKWRDFWSGGDEFGESAQGNTVGRIIDVLPKEASTEPFFAFWHTIRTHAPWNVDPQGRTIFPFRVPIVEGAHMVGAQANQTYTTPELKSLQRRLYANAAKEFDRELGTLMDYLKATGQFDTTMIIVTADHGATLTEQRDRRIGDTLEQRWAEVAHVPLLVKYPEQTEPAVVTAPRSTGQIARTVMRVSGAQAPAGLALAPDLDTDLPEGPVFSTVAGGVATPYVYSGIAEPDPWKPEDLAPPSEQSPFAVGIDAALIGQPVPEGWTREDASSSTLPGDSPYELLVVQRNSGACASTTGLVSSAGTVIGSVLWEGPKGKPNRGWAIVPRTAKGYSFWCAP